MDESIEGGGDTRARAGRTLIIGGVPLYTEGFV
jgi:hypothetical protein